MTDSEWIYGDDDGTQERIRSAEHWEPECEHVGASGKQIDVGL